MNYKKVLSNGMQIPEVFNFVSSTHFIYQFALMDGMIAVFVYLSNEHYNEPRRLSIRGKPALKFGSVVL